MPKNKKKQTKEQSLAQSIEALTQNGVKAFRLKEYEKAIATWERIPAPKCPTSMLAEAHFRLGLRLFYGADHQQGLNHLQAAAQSLPDDPTYSYHLGLASHRQSNLPGALRAYQTARKMPDPIASRAAYPLALALLQSGQDPDASPVWQELTPADQSALGAAGVFRRRPYHLPSAAPLLWHALVSLDSDDREQAQSQLEQVIAENPDSTEKSLAQYYLGVLAARADDWESARRAWETAAAAGLRLERLSANLAEIYQRRAEEALVQGHIQIALSAATEAKHHLLADNALDELLAQIHQQLGYQAATLNRWSEAQNHWQTAIKLDSGSFRLAYNLALAYEKSEDFLEAGETWREALRRRPRRADHPDALGDEQVARLWQRAAECYVRAGEFDEVGRIYQQAIKWAPENLELSLALAENALRDGRLQLARNELERVLERDPKHIPALVRMGEVWAHGDWLNRKQAPKYWQKALELDPKNTQARQFLAEWYIDQAEETHEWKKCDETIQNYQKSLEFRPGNVKVLSELLTCHLCLKRKTQADEYIRQALACAKNLDDYANLIDALLLFDDQYNRAKEVLALAEARLPDIPASFYVDMAGPLLKNHQKEQADFWLQKAIAKATSKDNILTMIADIAMDFDGDLAYEYAQKALAARENIGQAHVLLGALESKRGNKTASRKHFQEAERIARQTNDEELEYRIETARIYLAGPGALMRRLMDAGDPDLLDEFLDLFGKGLK